MWVTSIGLFFSLFRPRKRKICIQTYETILFWAMNSPLATVVDLGGAERVMPPKLRGVLYSVTVDLRSRVMDKKHENVCVGDGGEP